MSASGRPPGAEPWCPGVGHGALRLLLPGADGTTVGPQVTQEQWGRGAHSQAGQQGILTDTCSAFKAWSSIEDAKGDL